MSGRREPTCGSATDERVARPADRRALDEAQREALVSSADEVGLAIVGPAGSGKSTLLVARALRALTTLSPRQSLIVTSPNAASLGPLRAAIGRATSDPRVTARPLASLAFDLLATSRPSARRIDETAEALRFAEIARPLLELAWPAFFGDAAAPLDVEVSGMRSPERLLEAAFRLLRKLRGADIDARRFREVTLAGARLFYGTPPNLASVDLLLSTPEKYRDSLRVDAAELQRQHDRETDLALILARLFERDETEILENDRLTDTDAVFVASRRGDDARFARLRERVPGIFVDDAQELTLAERRLLAGIWGARLAGVTLAGDGAQVTRTLAGALGEAAFEHLARVEVRTVRRGAGAVAAAAARIVDRSAPSADSTRIERRRLATQRDEARWVAATIADLRRDDVALDRIAVVVRHPCVAPPYIEALLARDLDVDLHLAGAESTLGALDALAALWSVADPLRSAWLLRSLQAAWLRLSDASIALLCGTPDAQMTLLPTEARPQRGRERDHAQRFARNVIGGERDAELSPVAVERLRRFRDAHARWSILERRDPPLDVARRFGEESVLVTRTRRRARSIRARGRAPSGRRVDARRARSRTGDARRVPPAVRTHAPARRSRDERDLSVARRRRAGRRSVVGGGLGVRSRLRRRRARGVVPALFRA